MELHDDPLLRAILRTAADATGFPDGPNGNFFEDEKAAGGIGGGKERSLAKDIARQLCSFYGVGKYRTDLLLGRNLHLRRDPVARDLRALPMFLLEQCVEYCEKILGEEWIDQDETDLLQIHFEDYLRHNGCCV